MKRFKQPEIFERIHPRRTSSKKREDVRGSGVYPASGPWPKGKAEIRAPADWNRRQLMPGTVSKTQASSIAERAVAGARRRIRSEVDEAYSQGSTRERSRAVPQRRSSKT